MECFYRLVTSQEKSTSLILVMFVSTIVFVAAFCVAMDDNGAVVSELFSLIKVLIN